MTASDIDLAAADRLLSTTRTVRKRLDLERTVPSRVLLEALEIASQAPTGGNLQRVRWVVVTDPQKRRSLGEIYRRAMDPYHAIMEPMAAALGRNQKVVASSRYLTEVMGDVPVLVIPCQLGSAEEGNTFLEAAGYPHPLNYNVGASGFYGSAWPSVWSFMLALRARGVGSALTTMHLALEGEVGSLLGIPGSVTQIGMIPVAYYKGDSFKPAQRRPITEITYWDSWENRTTPAE